MPTHERPAGEAPAASQPLPAPRRRGSGDTTRALVLAYFFAPDARTASLRNTKILRHLPEHGIDLTVVTIREEFCVDPHFGAGVLRTVPAEVPVVRTGCVYPFEALGRFAARVRALRPGRERTPLQGARPAPRSSGGGAGKWQQFKDLVSYSLAVPDFYSGWLPYALLAGVEHALREPPDVIYAVGLPWTSFLAGYLLKTALRRPLVIDFMDPWARAEWSDRPPLFRRLDAGLEAFVVRRADHVIANTPEAAEDIRTRLGLPPERLSVLTCGFDPDEMPAPSAHRERRFTISHIGALYGERNPRNLLLALEKAVAEGAIPASGVRLNFVGVSVIQDPELERLKASPWLADIVRWAPWMPQREALQVVADSDVALVIQPRHSLAVPAKLYEYAGLRKPVLALADRGSAIERLMSREGWGVVVPNEDVAGIQAALVRLYQRCREGHVGAECRWDGCLEYTVQRLSGRLAEVMHRFGARSREARRDEGTPAGTPAG